ncbi:hypothetical protein SNEBB_001925 [Seison nebaliae]|nr:hypothetical protein SNEBB_001925 [Seison nebaliae]
MPLFGNVYDSRVAELTDANNLRGTDWAGVMDFCDDVNMRKNGCNIAVLSIMSRLTNKNVIILKHSIVLLNALVQNCGKSFLHELSTKKHVQTLSRIISQSPPALAEELKSNIIDWMKVPENKIDPGINLLRELAQTLTLQPNYHTDPQQTNFLSNFTNTEPKKNQPTDSEDEDNLMKAIALSLEDQEQKKNHVRFEDSVVENKKKEKKEEPRREPKEELPNLIGKQIKILYDFEAIDNTELTVKEGDLVTVIDDSDDNWIEGMSLRGRGFFPRSFASDGEENTSEPIKSEKIEKKNETNSFPLSSTLEKSTRGINEKMIDECLAMLQNADPTGEVQADSEEMLKLEDACYRQGPLIDKELEEIDSKHHELERLNEEVNEALNLFHKLMSGQTMPTSSSNYLPRNEHQNPTNVPSISSQIPAARFTPNNLPSSQNQMPPHQQFPPNHNNNNQVGNTQPFLNNNYSKTGLINQPYQQSDMNNFQTNKNNANSSMFPSGVQLLREMNKSIE